MTTKRTFNGFHLFVAVSLWFSCGGIPSESNEAVHGTVSQAATVGSGFTDSVFASNLPNGTAMEFAPDGRLFVALQTGELRVVKAGALLATPFVTLTVDSTEERGLLGVAFDPDFATNQWVYVYYTQPTPTVHNRVSRFTANGDVAAANSEVVLLELPNLGDGTHNGGAIHFGPDGMLYIGVGDNAVPGNSQSLSNLLGKLLRMNKDGSIPADNPFVGTAVGQNQLIWAYGLRNPFSFSFNPTTGRRFINDVGENTWEEIDDGIAGSNYGWPDAEGMSTNPAYRNPLYVYDHTQGCAISSGDFYAPPTASFPASFVGKYFFTDYCNGWLRVMDPATNTATDFATGLNSPAALRTGPDGSLYYLSRGAGAVGRISGAAATPPVITQQPASISVAAGQNASFTCSASGTAPLGYQWQRNDVNLSGATTSSYSLTATAADNGAQFRCVVSNSAGNATSNEATLTVTSGTGGGGTGGGTGGGGTGGGTSGGSDSAQYNFEAGLQGWVNAGTQFTSIATSTVQVFQGSQSMVINAAITGTPGTQRVTVATTAQIAGKTLTFNVYLPTGIRLSSLQVFAQENASTSWHWNGNWQPLANLRLGAWNTFSLPIRAAAAPLQSMGVEFTFSGSWTGAIYVDSIGWPASADGGIPDAGAPDAGRDAGTPDAGTPDAGRDAGVPDAGVPDAGVPDAGTPDAGVRDAGTPDAGFDAGVADAGTPTTISAIRFGATSGSDGLISTSPVDPNTRTISGWFRLRASVVPLNRQLCAWSLETDNPNARYQLFETTWHQNRWESHDNTQGGFLFAPVDLGWWFLAETNGAGSTILYFKKEGASTLTVVTGNDHPALTGVTRFLLGTDDANGQNEWMDGDITGVKIWGAVLSRAELELEANQLSPARTAGLYAYYPLQSVATMFNDASGNGRTLAPIRPGFGAWSLQTGPAIAH